MVLNLLAASTSMQVRSQGQPDISTLAEIVKSYFHTLVVTSYAIIKCQFGLPRVIELLRAKEAYAKNVIQHVQVVIVLSDTLRASLV